MARGEDDHLEQSAAILRMALVQHPDFRISLTGHAEPAAATRRASSERKATRRAEHVKTKLQANNIPDDKIAVMPPVITAEFGRGRNRFVRAEVTEG